ncbi:MAG: HIT family protein [Firmicutes bacterium HGW-Firmicutes-1]|jgi:diadenosine tetraphosphate (Ap4A) HIT family hydrolase|nr:MAG: HIT family protein [Firmicutes bacterium HGW-Firmicutes-1]
MHCYFCDLYIKSRENVVIENEFAFAIYDEFPISVGHALIVPKRHYGDYFLSMEQDVQSMFSLIREMKQIICKEFNPDGFNIGINVGKYAGQTLDHVHIHLIPRYKGDVKCLEGGVRNIIPHKGSYWHKVPVFKSKYKYK